MSHSDEDSDQEIKVDELSDTINYFFQSVIIKYIFEYKIKKIVKKTSSFWIHCDFISEFPPILQKIARSKRSFAPHITRIHCVNVYCLKYFKV